MILLLLIEYFMTSLPQMFLISCKKSSMWILILITDHFVCDSDNFVLRHNINGSFKCVLIYECVFIMRRHFAKNRIWKSSSCVWECFFLLLFFQINVLYDSVITLHANCVSVFLLFFIRRIFLKGLRRKKKKKKNTEL